MPTLKKRQQTASTRKEKKEIVRSIKYKEYQTELCTGDNSISADKAKELLGWREETEKEPLGNKYHKGLHDCLKKKVRLTNNENNRFFHKPVAEKLKQEFLRGRWRFNGEPIIVSKTGQIHNGQHTLISFLWAIEEWEASPEKFPLCPDTGPRLEKLIVYGISEDDYTINTLDTANSRSEADVIGRMPYFMLLKNDRDKRICSKMAANAVKLLWDRTSAVTNPYSIRRNLSETIDFIERHHKIIDCVQHIYEEDDGGKIGKLISIGYASAAMYLMASSNTDPEAYYKSDNPNESLLDFSQWDKASEFFVEIAGQSKNLSSVRTAVLRLMEEETRVTPAERLAIFAKAWDIYQIGKPVSAKQLELEYTIKEDSKVLNECPLFGGIDIGDELPFPTNGEKEVVEKRKAKVKAKKEKSVAPKQIAKRAGKEWAKGDTCWVHDPRGNSDTYFGKLSEDPYERYDGKLEVHVDADDGTWEALIENLSFKQFEMVQ